MVHSALTIRIIKVCVWGSDSNLTGRKEMNMNGYRQIAGEIKMIAIRA